MTGNPNHDPKTGEFTSGPSGSGKKEHIAVRAFRKIDNAIAKATTVAAIAGAGVVTALAVHDHVKRKQQLKQTLADQHRPTGPLTVPRHITKMMNDAAKRRAEHAAYERKYPGQPNKGMENLVKTAAKMYGLRTK